MTRGAHSQKTPLNVFDRSRVVGSVGPQQATRWVLRRRGLASSDRVLRGARRGGSLGGAAGTLAGYLQHAGPRATPRALFEDLTAAYAEETGLSTPTLPWHALRTPVTDLGTVSRIMCGARP